MMSVRHKNCAIISGCTFATLEEPSMRFEPSNCRNQQTQIIMVAAALILKLLKQPEDHLGLVQIRLLQGEKDPPLGLPGGTFMLI